MRDRAVHRGRVHRPLVERKLHHGRPADLRQLDPGGRDGERDRAHPAVSAQSDEDNGGEQAEPGAPLRSQPRKRNARRDRDAEGRKHGETRGHAQSVVPGSHVNTV